MLAEVIAGMVRRDEPPAELSRTFSARYALYIDGSFTPLEPKQHGHLRDIRLPLYTVTDEGIDAPSYAYIMPR